MPVAAERADVRLPRARKARERRRIERIALRAVSPLAGAHPLSFVARGLLHRVKTAGSLPRPSAKNEELPTPLGGRFG